MAEGTAPSHPNGNGERVTATLGSKSVGIRSAYPIVLVLLVCVVPLLTWLIQRERKELLDQVLTILNTSVEQNRRDFDELRYLHRETALAILRRLATVEYNLDREPQDRLPPGVLPPGVEEQLKTYLGHQLPSMSPSP